MDAGKVNSGLKKLNLGLISLIAGFLLVLAVTLDFLKIDFFILDHLLSYSFVGFLLYFFSIVFGIGSVISEKTNPKRYPLGVIGLGLGIASIVFPYAYIFVVCGLLQQACFPLF